MENIKERRENIARFPLYKMFSWDLLFYYAIIFLFLTEVKNISPSMVFLSEAAYTIFKIFLTMPSSRMIERIGKDKILEIYVNTIYFGDGYYGIKEASNGYLNKEPKEMTLYEATMLAGIPNAPSVYAPTVNPDLTRSRQKKVINDMVKYGYLTQEEADSINENK